MLKCIAIDDEQSALDILDHYCKKISFIQLDASFRDPFKALEYIRKNHTDLIFLDINMPGLSGLQFFSLLPQKPKVIFTTAYSEHAVKSYDLNALDYLLKPIEFERFMAAILKFKEIPKFNSLLNIPVSQTIQTDNCTLFIKSGTDFHQIFINQIRYVKSDGNYVTFITNKRPLLSRQTLNEVELLLPANRFVRIHRSYLVAIPYIDTIKTYAVKIGSEEIPVSTNFRPTLLKMIEEWNSESNLTKSI